MSLHNKVFDICFNMIFRGDMLTILLRRLATYNSTPKRVIPRSFYRAVCATRAEYR